MKGRPQKKRKGPPRRTSREKVNLDTVSSPATEEQTTQPDNSSQSTPPVLLNTPKTRRGRSRQTQEPHQTSTPVSSPLKDRPSTSPYLDTLSSQATEKLTAEPDNDSTAPVLLNTPKTRRGRSRQSQEPHQTSTPVSSPSNDHLSKSPSRARRVEITPCCKSNSQSRRRSVPAAIPRQLRKRVAKEQTQTCIKSSCPPAKRRCGRKQKVEEGNLQRDNSTTQSSARSRPRFELELDESLLSSDLSIELSHHEEQLPSLSFQEDEESGEEVDLPSFLMQDNKKPPSIREGVFVWCKCRLFPFWPALVKSVNRKTKKASIVFIDYPIAQKGFTVTLKTLKPFDCEGATELVCAAKEKYDARMDWSLELIEDYRIRIACGSFSGSFIEYFAHDMSYPVRRKYPLAASETLTIGSDDEIEEQSDDHKEDSFTEQQQEEVSRSPKRLLPDRTHAAHNRANEKLVHFIVKQRMVERRLLAVIRGQEQSRWLRSFQSTNRRRVVNAYLEDEQQLDQVYQYLNELSSTADNTAPCQTKEKSIERVPFVLDVLLPEAIINAIAGVDNVSLKKAEEKYLKGRCLSNREIQEFHVMIEKQIKLQHQNTAFSKYHHLED